MTTTDTDRVTQTGSGRWSPSWAKWPRVLIRIGLGIAAALVAGIGAAIALFFGVIEATGCFIGCNDPAPLVGVPLLALAAGLSTVGLVALWWAIVDRYWKGTLRTLAIVGSIFGLGLIAATTGIA